MPLRWNEIRERARACAVEWQGTEKDEDDARSLVNAFVEIELHRQMARLRLRTAD
ncbi:MAG: hypothetical protein KF683_09315 [Rubrivivax sp.]|nr:hypothetical protein [Rubrivivax sp.]